LVTLTFWITLATGLIPANAEAPPPGGTFFDDDGNVHEGSIDAIAAAGITVGCDDLGEFFCPDAEVTRAQMASFLTRAFDLTPRNPERFTDAAGVYARDIGAIESVGWVTGCNPPANDLFCPDRPVTRGEVAKMLSRALDLPASDDNVFIDDDTSPFQADIQRLFAAGITKGCTADRFCPRQAVTRAEMASFLARALRLPTPRPDDPFDGRMVLGLPSLVGYGGLAVMEDTRMPTTIIEDSVGQPRLSPDGNEIAYIDIRRECPANAQGPDDCYSRLFTLPFDGGLETQVTPNDYRPFGHDWTADGDEIAFFDSAATGGPLTAVDPKTGSIRRLSDGLPEGPIYLDWSSKDVLAVTISRVSDPDYSITLMTPEGEVIGLIEEPGRNLLYARWSPDGTRLAYWSETADGAELVVSDSDGGNRRVVDSAGEGWQLAWSPDGTRIAFLNGLRVFCVDVASGETWPLTPSSLSFNAVDWR
jgi:hypothetical protein